jgi:Gram-positive signal peptide protein, YSIRK family
MFHNKREIFSFRKYKAYGLASAVIAAFFLAGGVAHADEVTPATTAEVTQVAPEAVTDAPTNESTQPTSVTTPAAKPVEESGVAPETTGRTPEIAEGTPNTNSGESFDRAASETNTQIHGDFVVTGTDKSEKHLTKSDRVDGAYMLEGTYTFTSSGTDTVSGA